MSRRVDGVGTGAVVARRPSTIVVLSFTVLGLVARSPLGLLYMYPQLLVSLHAASNRTAETTAAVCLVPGEAEAQIGL